MSKRAPKIKLSQKEKKQIEAELARRSTPQGRAVRLRIIMEAAGGKSNKEIASDLGQRPNTVSLWRGKFAQRRMEGLKDERRSGRKVKNGEEFRGRVLAKLEGRPPDGLSCWNGPALAAELGENVHAVWRLLRKEGICLQRQRSWCVSTDPEFAAKAADIVGLYLGPPENAIVLSVDEKPSIQALERRQGYVRSSNGKIVRGYRSTYKRNGTLNLFAALEVACGRVHGKLTTTKKREDFRSFIAEVVDALPSSKQIHIIVDNLSTHKKNEEWLAERFNGRASIHFTPTGASWLNLVEVFFALLSRESLRGADLRSTEELRDLIEKYILRHNSSGRVFLWQKREVKGTQLRNTIANICK